MAGAKHTRLDEPTPAGSKRQRPQQFYRPELDLLRLLAFLMVWSSHALLAFSTLFPRAVLETLEGAGSCGVPVFFFLSAFLITELFRRERCLRGTLQLRSFYVRRALRIWPLYYGVLAVYAVLGLFFHGFRIEHGRLLASCLMVGNWYLVVHPWISTPMRALWSISVEEQWYLFWPALHRSLERGQSLLLCCGVVVLSGGLLLFLAEHAPPASLYLTAWVNTGVQFQYFALGAAAALLLNGRVPGCKRVTRAGLGFAGAACMLVAAGRCHLKSAETVPSGAGLVCGYMLAGAGAAALFFAFYGLEQSRCPRMLVRLGQLSFGLYVFHETGFFIANALSRAAHLPTSRAMVSAEKLLALVLTVLMAWLSYHLWELRFLRLKSRWAVVRTREAQ
ncbi:acyltransferase [Acidipila sp. EB88]|uniref:acyltransferase family protein n=1 Tax=Acidipila sp. EB88 TaxID=2305226 RepID=UPI00131530F1|nr:acyltransferase [Acidipila sp. EB88]